MNRPEPSFISSLGKFDLSEVTPPKRIMMPQEHQHQHHLTVSKDKMDNDSDSMESSDDENGYSYSNSMDKNNHSPNGEMKMKIRGPSKAASPVIIQWLTDNYEAQEGTSLPRSTLYAHYVNFCTQMVIEPVNAASFGKLIRSIFPNLKTRRLGTRGHSKYHYYGVRIKPNSELRLLTPTILHDMQHSPSHSNNSSSNNSDSPHHSSSGGKNKSRAIKKEDIASMVQNINANANSTTTIYDTNVPTITTGATNIQLPEFNFPENIVFPPEISMEDAQSFMALYQGHCQTFVDTVYKHHFAEVDKIFRVFWQSLAPQYRAIISSAVLIDQIIEKDHITYKAMAAVLLPNVLQALPVSMPQAIRQFAKQLEPSLAASLDGLPTGLCVTKLMVIKKFSQSLHKQASLNHLTQAARAVLQNPNQIQQMVADWNRLDFEFIKDQASWVCQCGDEIVQSAQEDFKRFLIERASLEQWAQWLQDIVTKIIGKYHDPRELLVASQQLLLKWSFYSTLIIRDLTIRNASSFGSFHLLRTLFDEYIFYLVESKFSFYSPQLSMYPVYNDQHSHHIPENPFSTPNESYHPYPYSLDSLLNKDTSRSSSSAAASSQKLPPYPYPDPTHDKHPEEDYTMMNHQDNYHMHHMQQQPYAPQYPSHQQRGGYVQQQSSTDMRMNPMMMRPNLMTESGKRSADMMKMMYPSYPTMNYGMNQNQMGSSNGAFDSYIQPSVMHYRNENDVNSNNGSNGNKKVRVDSQLAEVK